MMDATRKNLFSQVIFAMSIILLGLLVIVFALWTRDRIRLSRQISELKESNRLFAEILRSNSELQGLQKHIDVFTESFSTVELEEPEVQKNSD
jgi:hypothetical protein